MLVNGAGAVLIERSGRLEVTDVRFGWAAELRDVIERIAPLGRRVDEAEPLCDARLPDPTRASQPGSSASRVCAPTALVLCHRERVERIESGWSTGPSGVDSHRATVGPTQLASDDM